MIITVLVLLLLFAIGVPRLYRLADKRAWVTYVCLFVLVAVFTLRYMANEVTYGPLEAMMHLIRDELGLSLRVLSDAMREGI
jgi:hypothetical protein